MGQLGLEGALIVGNTQLAPTQLDDWSAPRYSLGVQGGRYFSARAQLRGEAITGMILFNDPEQLALFPFATNALSLRLVVDLAAGG